MGVDIKDSVSVREALIKSGITPIDGVAYILYECGHSFDVKDDPAKMLWYNSAGRTLRSCPKCKHRRILIKYKRCSCGVEQVGSKVHTSNCCGACASIKQGEDRNNSHYKRNGHLADSDRGFCIHRNECLTKYIDCVTVPCKHCHDYSTTLHI